jgi:hypothetical protein
MNFLETFRRTRKAEKSPDEKLRILIAKHRKRGRSFAEKHKIDELLPLDGENKNLLHLLLGKRLLGYDIEKEMTSARGLSRGTGEIYETKLDNKKSASLRDEENVLRGFIDNYTQGIHNLNKARSIQRAVTDLFIEGENSVQEKEKSRFRFKLNWNTVRYWAFKWEPEILSHQSSSQG